MTRKGLIQPKPMMTRVCKTPPEKKFQKKIFEVQLFFSRKKIFWFGGFLSSWVFYLKPNPCHRGFRSSSCHHGTTQTTRVIQDLSIRPTRSPHDTPTSPPRSPREAPRSPWQLYCPYDTSGFTSGGLKTGPWKPGFSRLGESRGTGQGSMTRGGRSGGIDGGRLGCGGTGIGDVTRRGLNSTKTHDDTGLQIPPRKKIPKKFFGVQLFFSRKKFFWFGGFCHHGFFI